MKVVVNLSISGYQDLKVILEELNNIERDVPGVEIEANIDEIRICDPTKSSMARSLNIDFSERVEGKK